jgi:hypothetical protein
MISESTANIIRDLVLNWQKTIMFLGALLLVLFVGFPTFYIGLQFSQSLGLLPSVYSQEHANLRADNEAIKGLVISLTHVVTAMTNEVRMSNEVASDVAFFSQRLCIIQSKNEGERNDCMAPKWRRNLEVKP